MNTRKIILGTLTALALAGVASPAFADGDIDGQETIFETIAGTQIQPVSLPNTVIIAKPKTIAEEAFDLTSGH